MAESTTLVTLAEDERLPLAERISAAHRLAAEGDPRIAFADRVRVTWPEGSNGSPFAIDRFPVTVGSYARFIDAGGYRQRDFWTEEGWSWRIAHAIQSPRFWGELEWEAYLIANHPVVGVSYYEAEAYASFVDARLPSEAEWERAATGGDDRTYPWGAEWREGACGMRGVGPRSTVPIGVFPENRSPTGARDLVGCVWQWCSDPFTGWGREDGAQLRAADDQIRHAVRGGAWNTLQWSVTCQSRNGYPCGARFSNLGFRCVADPSSG